MEEARTSIAEFLRLAPNATLTHLRAKLPL